MKKILMVAFVALCAMAATGCDKEPQPQPEPTNSLKGTSWECVQTESISYSGFEVAVEIAGTLEFTTVSAGVVQLGVNASLNGTSLYSTDIDTHCTYTLNEAETEGVITTDETEQMGVVTLPFTVNADGTLTSSYTVELVGHTFTLTFNKVQ